MFKIINNNINNNAQGTYFAAFFVDFEYAIPNWTVPCLQNLNIYQRQIRALSNIYEGALNKNR